MNKLKLLDLFSGIGGFSYGLESTNGFETIAFCEKDKFCQKVLKKHWNDIKIYEDVRNIKGSEIKADVITGGFPCQPFSVAGKRKGTDDDRYLWDETIRVVAETKPKWFIGENVEGIVNIQEGKILQQIQKDLEAESFQVQCLIIPASGIGAWHQRKRVWIIGYSDNNGSHRQKRNETKSSSNQSKDRLFVGNDKDVSNTESIRSRKSRNFNQEKRFETSSSTQFNGSSQNVSNSNGKESFKKQQTWWQTQSELCGVPNGISTELDKDRTNRIKSLGNSIVPEIARELGLAILKAEDEQFD
jgi:DNA (cytosine-5)-methyltransferase 1